MLYPIGEVVESCPDKLDKLNKRIAELEALIKKLEDKIEDLEK
jgi:prefoldin subunit 5